jgi:hypothetical protein
MNQGSKASSAKSGDISAQIGRLEAIEAIGEMSAQYCQGFDRHVVDMFAGQFAQDGIFQVGRKTRYVGRAEISRTTTDELWPAMPRTTHLFGNLSLTSFDPDSHKAGARADGFTLVGFADGSQQLFLSSYKHDLVEHAGTWTLAECRADVAWRIPLPLGRGDQPQQTDWKIDLVVPNRTRSESSLSERVQRLEDRDAIAQAVYDYNTAFDRRDIALFLDQFEETGTFGVDGKSWTGRTLIEKIIAVKSWPKIPRSTHLGGNVIISFPEQRGESGVREAVVASDCIAILTRDTGEVHLSTAAYRDRMSNRTGKWRFVERLGYGTGFSILARA